MLRLIGKTNINFMGARKVAFGVSVALILLGVASLAIQGGPKYSIDFAGGKLVELQFAGAEVSADDVRSALSDAGVDGAEVQMIHAGRNTGDNPGVLLRFPLDESDDGAGSTASIISALESRVAGADVEIRRQESVGPKVGSELRGDAIRAILFALGAILIYISIRYEFVFALGAVAALFHDLFITIGIFSILGVEVSLPIVAALLTIAGYSINDTIVLFDRIRERRRADQKAPLIDIINGSINQMLSRTVVTSLTTLFSALALYIFGGSVIHDFAFAIVIGVIIGTYSSIFVATALVLTIHLTRDRRRSAKRSARKPVAAT